MFTNRKLVKRIAIIIAVALVLAMSAGIVAPYIL